MLKVLKLKIEMGASTYIYDPLGLFLNVFLQNQGSGNGKAFSEFPCSWRIRAFLLIFLKHRLQKDKLVRLN